MKGRKSNFIEVCCNDPVDNKSFPGAGSGLVPSRRPFPFPSDKELLGYIHASPVLNVCTNPIQIVYHTHMYICLFTYSFLFHLSSVLSSRWKQGHLFMQENEKESPGGLSFPSKTEIKIIYIKCRRWLFYWNKRIFAITSCYVQQGGASKAIMQFSKVSLIKRWVKKTRMMQQLSKDLCRIWMLISIFISK